MHYELLFMNCIGFDIVKKEKCVRKGFELGFSCLSPPLGGGREGFKKAIGQLVLLGSTFLFYTCNLSTW